MDGAMTSVDVAEGRRLCEAATAGPWEVMKKWETYAVDSDGEWVFTADSWVDYEFIVWARNNLPALLTAHEAALERMRAEVLEEAAGIVRQTVAEWEDNDSRLDLPAFLERRILALLGDRA